MYLDSNYALFWEGTKLDHRIGIYMKGACDLPSVFSCIPAIREGLNGTCCMLKEGLVADSRSDILLQTLEALPTNWVETITSNLHLKPGYFEPRLFEKTFSVRGPKGLMEFPKSVVMLTIAPDVVRTAYRHKETGVIVDPGGWWLNQSFQPVLGNLETVKWMRENFESTGLVGIEQFSQNFAKIIDLVKANTGAHIAVFNVLTVEPGTANHNYQFVSDPHSRRRREFNIALADLSRQLDFSIIDVDRVLKRVGITDIQIDFAHFPVDAYAHIGGEVLNVLRDYEVVR